MAPLADAELAVARRLTDMPVSYPPFFGRAPLPVAVTAVRDVLEAVGVARSTLLRRERSSFAPNACTPRASAAAPASSPDRAPRSAGPAEPPRARTATRMTACGRARDRPPGS